LKKIQIDIKANGYTPEEDLKKYWKVLELSNI
jgi:hypothetical protein